jgi:hypothetical protein
MLSITCPAGTGEYESLAVAVRGVLRSLGQEHSYAELVSILGIGALFTAVPHDPLRRWSQAARDAALLPASSRLGLRLRDLHPPAAAAGLEQSAEFALHFEDSYLPLIRRAVEHEQPVLAWCGWQRPEDFRWGVITGVEDGRAVGCPAGESQPRPLLGPALQVYVIERREPGTVDSAQLLKFVAELAVAEWTGLLACAAGVQTGAAAWQTWQATLESGEVLAKATAHEHVALATAVDGGRAALASWLRELSLDDPAAKQLADRWASAIDALRVALHPLLDEPALNAQLKDSSGRSAVAREIAACAEREATLREELARWPAPQREE